MARRRMLRWCVPVAWTWVAAWAGASAAGQVMAIRGRADPAGAVLPDKAVKEGLHLPQGRQVGFNYNLNDGGGYLWDLQYYLNVGQGTNYIYSGGMYCQVQGQNVNSNGRGWTNAAGDEVEIGPWNRGQVQIYRRCKVYRDAAFARWLDIFVNNSGAAQTVSVRVYSSTNNTVGRTITSSGAAAFGEKDWAFITDHQQGRPSLLHVVAGPKSKVRPTVQIQSNNIFVLYNLNVPAGETVVLCYWEGQGNTVEELQERMKKFNLNKMLSDLTPAVKKLIVNLGRMGEAEDIELTRSGTGDCVVLTNDDPIFGKIANPSYTLEAFYGTMDLPAGEVIGIVGAPGRDDLVRAVLRGGQVLSGRLKDDKLRVELPIGGVLEIPFAKVRQCAYRISAEKPEQQAMTDPLILLRTGDRLAFDPAGLTCTFRTRHGDVLLTGKDLVEVQLDHPEHGVHRAVFRNGSTLAGLLGPERITAPLRVGKKLDISRDMVRCIRFAEESDGVEGQARAVLNNEDELFGRLADQEYVIATDFNTVRVKPDNIRGMSFDPDLPNRVAVELWDGTTLRGRLENDLVHFQVVPGPTLALSVGHLALLECPSVLPPDQVVQEVAKQVARLSAPAYKDRQEAQEALVKMGPVIVPLLQKHLKDRDPEVRQRVTVILEKLGGSVTPPPQSPDEEAQFPMFKR